jgi:beta-xylosidase
MGPYEDKIVLHQGETEVNGPHQGGYVELDSGESWFIHFQDREAYGRIVHLQPMGWENDWPVMGIDTNGDQIGEPVIIHKKPDVGGEHPFAVPETNDEFDSETLGLQWQWQANWQEEWYSLKSNPGSLRLFAQPLPAGTAALYEAPHVVCQKIPSPAFKVSVKVTFAPDQLHDMAGLTIFGHEYRYAALRSTDEGVKLIYVHGKGGKEGSAEKITDEISLPASIDTFYFRVNMILEANCRFEYSLDGTSYLSIGEPFLAVPGGWVGAKIGLFCMQTPVAGKISQGYADIDWIRFEEH